MGQSRGESGGKRKHHKTQRNRNSERNDNAFGFGNAEE